MTSSETFFSEDPWNWSVDQVVAALCDPNAPFRALRNSEAQVPESAWLEQKLREHCIQGDSLLTALNYVTLREEIGIVPLGPRQIIIHEIQRLRWQSRRYLEHLQTQLPDPVPGHDSYFGPSRRGTRGLQSPTSLLPARNSVAFETTTQSTLVASEASRTEDRTLPTTVNEDCLTQLQSSIHHSQEWLDGLPDVPKARTIDGHSPVHDEQSLNRQDETHVIDEHGRKRRRLVLATTAPLESEDPSGLAATEGETITCEEHDRNVTPTLGASCTTANVVNHEGKKRIAPTLITKSHESLVAPSPDANEFVEALQYGKNERRFLEDPGKAYLGTKALTVDTVFYDSYGNLQILGDVPKPDSPGVHHGSDIQNFAFLGAPAASGQCRYVAARVQYFLRQNVGLFRCGSKRRYGIIPYPDKLGQMHKALSITIFETEPGTNNVHATRKDRVQWRPDDLPYPVVQESLVDSTDTAVFNVPASFQQDDEQDWDFLEKWNYTHDERVLPVYGDSGSEGEYDLDTWHEMEKEKGTKLVKPLGRSRGLKKLTDAEVQDAINNAIRSVIEDWKQKRLPKLQRTAWLLWFKTRRNRTKKAQVASLDHDIQHFASRLDKLRQQITREQWLSTAKVKRQCESMRRTIYGLEDSKWTVATLQQKVRPDKPFKLSTVKSARVSVEESDLEMESSVVETSAGDDLEGFIVDDDDSESGILEGDHSMINGDSTTDEDSDQEKQTVPHNEPNLDVPASMIPKAPVNFIDLTLDSDASEPEIAPPSTTLNSGEVKTPPACSANIDEVSSQRVEQKRAQFKSPPGMEKYTSAISKFAATAVKLPELCETEKISEMDPTLLMERADRKRLLIYILTKTPHHRREKAYAWLSGHGLLDAQDVIWRTLDSVMAHCNKFADAKNHKEAETLKSITAWFVCWTNAVIVYKQTGANREQMETAAADKEGFEPFYNFLLELRCLVDYTKTSKHSDNGSILECTNQSQTTPTKQGRELIDYSSDELQVTASKKRKYVVPESQEAAELRKKAHQRVDDREKRQAKLKSALQKMGQTEEDPSQVVVNLGKLENQDLIYLQPSIGGRIQSHQKDGLRFLWREIIEDHASKQGCLLAQAMGLGKTMQVISFLVTVADAARSPNANIRNQIPPRLRESKTLVLCPPTLIENWYDEFLLWAPENMTENIGEVRQVSSAMSLDERLRTVQEWGDDGGVLVLGSSLLKELILNPLRKKKEQPPLSEAQHVLMKDILLKGPNIVVVDEAHTAKNPTSQLNKILGRFEARSRIALTGSPLSNNLSEYYALIQWIAPGYLGDHREFVSRYEEPIQQGLYRDSTEREWRVGLKRLELFKREVQPKIHRVDNSVLAARLKGKSEFVIKVALTDLQEKLYQCFVDSMNEQLQGSEGPRQDQATLWAWVAKLRLVCNHPKCFHDNLMGNHTAKSRLKQRKPGQTADVEEVKGDDEALIDASPSDMGMSDELVRRQLEPFNDLSVPLESISLANKTKLLLQIIELCQVAGDKILVFSHSILTLNYVESILIQEKKRYTRIDGKVPTQSRQRMTKVFNQDKSDDVFLISTRAGGTGLNLFGANRVVIIDDHFNPTWEEQAVGRAYRIGQLKHVYVYRLTVGGTFEEAIHNQSLFKQQLASRAVDKKSIARSATRGMRDYFKPLKPVEQTDLAPFKGKDPHVLDHILASQNSDPFIRAIVPCETFQQEVEEKLTAEEQKEIEAEEADSRLRRNDPAAYQAKVMAMASGRAHPRAPGGAIPPPPVHGNLPERPSAPISSHFPIQSPANSTPGVTRTGRVDPTPNTPPPGYGGPLNTAGLSGSVGHQANTHVSPYPTSGQEGLLPILSANTTLELNASAPLELQKDGEGTRQGSEKEASPSPQASENTAAAYDFSPKRTFAKYPGLQGLLAREEERARRQRSPSSAD
ncbi:MAG: hypothetical protein Q9181_005177 [Wetmoreana brouardii]